MCVRKTGNKVKPQNTPNCSMKERKRGFRWRLDTCTFNQRNFEGKKHAFVLRDSASDAFEIMHGIYRNDFSLQFKQWVNKIRPDPRMQGESHVIVSPHTVQSDTTRCGRKPCGPRSEASPTSTYRFYFSLHQNNIILLLDDNALFLLGNVML
jgi:hypothetical protein